MEPTIPFHPPFQGRQSLNAGPGHEDGCDGPDAEHAHADGDRHHQQQNGTQHDWSAHGRTEQRQGGAEGMETWGELAHGSGSVALPS